jgi:hypothetical protein
MKNQERNLTPETREFEINQQINAVTRALELLGKDGRASLNDIIEALAKAEVDSQFLCGFVDLNSAESEKQSLEQELVKRGFATIENGNLKLTNTGKQRANIPLPLQIEEALTQFK